MKKYLAFLLVAIMATSVLGAAGVVTTQKAAAQPTVQYVAVNYKVGATYRYAPWQFNNHLAYFLAPSGGNPQHSEAASGGVAYASMRTTLTQQAESRAYVGINWKLNLPLGVRWLDVENMPCTVTMRVLYYVAAKGNQFTSADESWGPYDMNGPFPQTAYVNGAGNTLHTQSAWVTKTFTSTVGNLFWSNEDGLVGGAGGSVVASQDLAGAGQASALIICSSIVLSFPQASPGT